MTSEQIDPTDDTRAPGAAAVTQPETGAGDGPAPATQDPSRRSSIARPMSAIGRPVAGVVTAARTSVSVARRGAGRVAERLPGTIHATRIGARDATSALQTLPDPTLRSLAASSVGLGAGFYLTRAPRLVIVAGVLPAMIMGAAIALRPREQLEPIDPQGSDR